MKLFSYRNFVILFTVLPITALITVLIFLNELPEFSSLKTYKPNVLTRVHSSDGTLVKEFSREYRIFIPIEDIPIQLKQAFISAEDKNFYNHFGIDGIGILKASIRNISNYLNERRPQGASTITQQVAKNFLLNDELSLRRKIKEALLAIKIEQVLEKDRILELYLNQIYLGSGTYGVAAASNRYFKKSLSELSIDEMAFLAALPKAPSRYHPKRNYEKAFDRRNYVLKRMFANDFLNKDQLETLLKKPLITELGKKKQYYSSKFFIEEIRKKIINIFDEETLYHGGLSVRTSLDTRTQSLADNALKNGLKNYDKRHGFKGPLNKFKNIDLKLIKQKIKIPDSFLLARVKFINDNKATIEVLINDDLKEGYLSDFKWARKYINDNYVGPKIDNVDDIVEKDDVILVSNNFNGTFSLEQIPEVNGAIVVMDPFSGRILAMSGGFDFKLSNFNRALQANRQPGSAFKPFVYMSALENGLQPNSLILDAPFVIDQGGDLGKWKPENYGKKFYGPTPLRIGIENSRNLMTIRIAQYLGMDKVSEMANRTGILNDMPKVLSMSLGAGETSLIKLTSAYASFVNGGKHVYPNIIDRIQDRRGNNIYLADFGICENCTNPFIQEDPRPKLKTSQTSIFSPVNSYQMVSILKGAVDRGTGKKTKIENIEIGGKTGTTNNNTDAWFIGFTSEIIVGIYVGFDSPKSLGKRETGSSVALPIFKEFMTGYYEDDTPLPFVIPSGIELVQINHQTGQLSSGINDPKSIYEAFSKSDNLVNNFETLTGADGFQIIQVEEDLSDDYVLY